MKIECKRCNSTMQLDKKKVKSEGIEYFDYYLKCNVCGVEKITEITAKRSANSFLKAKKKSR